jgi:hypothetical protein
MALDSRNGFGDAVKRIHENASLTQIHTCGTNEHVYSHRPIAKFNSSPAFLRATQFLGLRFFG